MRDMDTNNCVLVETISGVCFTVTLQSSESANKSIEEYIKDLITDEILSLEVDGT